MANSQPDIQALAQGILQGDRRAIAKTITLVESSRPEDQKTFSKVLKKLYAEAGAKESLRIGITGIPGVGKSSFIEALGMEIVRQGHRVAVLSVDPSSPVSGGSLLGDKTRMTGLGSSAEAMIRPSPSGHKTSGVTRASFDAMRVFAYAGFDFVFIETVGTGQSDIEVRELVDVLLLLHMPLTGDELQASKKGIVELADMVVVTKADGDLEEGARRSATEISAASDGKPVLLVSNVSGKGVPQVLEKLQEMAGERRTSGELRALRERQIQKLLTAEVVENLLEKLRQKTSWKKTCTHLGRDILKGELSIFAAGTSAVKEIL